MRALDFFATDTPIQQADRLAEALDLAPGRLWIKRDDLTGLVGGGNKARKLERLVADALTVGARTLVTTGAAQSNHVRATAAAARAAGLDCVAVLTSDGPPTRAEGNLILDDLLGVQVVWARPDQRDQMMATTVAQLADESRAPYAIPVGGTNAIGASAYVRAAQEIEARVPDCTVVCAVGTGGTQAGLIVGLGEHDRVIGVDTAALTGLAARVPDVIAECAQQTGRPQPGGAWRVDPTPEAASYGAPIESVRRAIELVASTTGLVLDPVYTGRAMAGLIARAERGDLPRGPIVFLHSGGLPALFAQRYEAWFDVPENLTGQPR